MMSTRRSAFAISIHAPRTGSDVIHWQGMDYALAISIHAPRTGSDPKPRRCARTDERNFNPRSPHGERLHVRHSLRFEHSNFNPRSPHGERQQFQRSLTRGIRFQSTLPARGATRRLCASASVMIFQSTLPARGATVRIPREAYCIVISIHAPRTGSDVSHPFLFISGDNFNPRSPHGERPPEQAHRRARAGISIHAPRTGSDNPPHDAAG